MNRKRLSAVLVLSASATGLILMTSAAGVSLGAGDPGAQASSTCHVQAFNPTQFGRHLKAKTAVNCFNDRRGNLSSVSVRSCLQQNRGHGWRTVRCKSRTWRSTGAHSVAAVKKCVGGPQTGFRTHSVTTLRQGGGFSRSSLNSHVRTVTAIC
jgi:hypothetical protein